MKNTQYLFYVSAILILLSCNPSDISKVSETQEITLDSNKNAQHAKADVNNKLVGNLYIDIPEDLKEIDEEKIKIKYPGANRPDYVYGTDDMGVNLAYSLTDKSLELNELEQFLETTSSALRRQVGNEYVTQAEMDTVNGIPFAIIEFYSPTPDEGKIYNLMFTTSLEDKMTIISFNCLQSRMIDWEEEVPEIFSSIKLGK